MHSADVDIDLGRGLAHAKEWLENNVFRPGHKTNQALVYALLYAQGILPRYTLDPVAGDDESRGAQAHIEGACAAANRAEARGPEARETSPTIVMLDKRHRGYPFIGPLGIG